MVITLQTTMYFAKTIFLMAHFVFQKILTVWFSYHILQIFDGGKFYKFLAFRQNFTIQSFLPIAVCMEG